VVLVRDRQLKSPELTGEWEAKLRQIERGRLEPRPFIAEIIRYTGEVIHSAGATAVDNAKLGDCPRCGRPVIEGKRGYGCSGWRQGCPFVLWREYKGHRLSEDQIRELLQHRVLLRPLTLADAGEVILQMADSGAVMEIPVPAGQPRRPLRETTPRRTRRRKATNAGQPEPAPSATPGAQQGRSPVGNQGAPGLGPCPLCGSDVIEQERSYGCSGWRSGCKFAIWKTIAGKRISARTAQELLSRGRSRLLKGFASKSGRPFEARLKLEAGQVRFDFQP